MPNKIAVAAIFLLLFSPLGSAQHQLEKMTWKEIGVALKGGTNTAIITIGATEQHGPQLALASDSATGDCLARDIAERVGQTLITPNIRLGISPHHMNFPGTITVRSEVLKSLVYEYVHSLAWHGFRHIFILPTHGTNFKMAGELEVELRQLYPHMGIFSFSDAEAYINALTETSKRLGINLAAAGSHSGLSETSMVLACQPELVDLESAEQGFMGDAYAMGEKLNREGTDSISPIGVLGDPRESTVKAGEAYLESLTSLLSTYFKQRREGWVQKLPGNLPGGILRDPEGNLAEGIKARRSGNFEKARSLFKKKFRSSPDDAMILLELARTDTLDNKITAAKRSLETLLLKKHSNETLEKIHDELALVSLYQGRFADATEHKLEAKRLASDLKVQGLKLFYVGYFQVETGRVNEALKSYQQALALAPDKSDINLDIEHLSGLAMVKSGRLLDAAQRLRVIGDAVRDPEYQSQIRRFYHLNGEILLSRNRPKDASVNFLAALEIYNHPLYRESLARARWQDGDIKGAIVELKKLIALTDARLDIPIHYIKAHYQLGQLHELLGEVDEAKDWYQRFLHFWNASDLDLVEIRDARKKTGM
jgi:creatinine amidohydrolase/Fe(II)-dependent formamide hydrolase-like protein/Tfp pilus assembly protein PilF